MTASRRRLIAGIVSASVEVARRIGGGNILVPATIEQLVPINDLAVVGILDLQLDIERIEVRPGDLCGGRLGPTASGLDAAFRLLARLGAAGVSLCRRREFGRHSDL